MRRARLVLALLAVIGLLSFVPLTSASATCPLQPSMHMMHHGHPSPAPMKNADCAACMAVLPSLAVAESQTPLPSVSFQAQLISLFGIDPALDPPPPRTR